MALVVFLAVTNVMFNITSNNFSERVFRGSARMEISPPSEFGQTASIVTSENSNGKEHIISV